MKKKKIILTVVLITLILVSGFFYSFVKKSQPVYDTQYSRSQMIPTLMVYEGNDVTMEFECKYDNLTQVQLILSGTSDNTNKDTLSYSICDETGREYADGSIKFSKFKSGKFTTLKFSKIKDSKNKTFVLKLSTDNESDRAAFVSVTPDMKSAALNYVYVKWDMQTMIIYILFMAYLIGFILLLTKLFRK